MAYLLPPSVTVVGFDFLQVLPPKSAIAVQFQRVHPVILISHGGQGTRAQKLRCAFDSPVRTASTTPRPWATCWFPHHSYTSQGPRSTAPRHALHNTPSWVTPLRDIWSPCAPRCLSFPCLFRRCEGRPLHGRPLSIQEPTNRASCRSRAEGGSLSPARGNIPQLVATPFPVLVARGLLSNSRGRHRSSVVAVPPPSGRPRSDEVSANAAGY